ncbi:MAG: S-adenosylmethionine synthetase N-terminal domain-containing protein [bacterium]|nr:S-adenosylmethionine synthetase N-terminal domain-containing protein [bacterium]
MKSHIAEYVSPGHPDRLADAIVESIVDLAVGRDSKALVGVECAVHTDHVFIDGRIAARKGKCAVTNEEIEEIARKVYQEAGYGGIWIHAPEKLKVIQNVCLEPLSDDERAIRNLSDDQNVVTGFACSHPGDGLFAARTLHRQLYRPKGGRMAADGVRQVRTRFQGTCTHRGQRRAL